MFIVKVKYIGIYKRHVMIKVNILLPAFKISKFATEQEIIREAEKLTGFQDIRVSSFFFDDGIENDDQENTQICLEIKNFNVNLNTLEKTIKSAWSLQSENQILKRDLSQMYKLYEQKIKQLTTVTSVKTASENMEKMEELQQADESVKQLSQEEEENFKEQKQEKRNKMRGEERLELRELEQQIRNLVKQKLSNEQIIQKYDHYCQELIEIIRKNKISIM